LRSGRTIAGVPFRSTRRRCGKKPESRDNAV
jgi:hypothetical protein